jgi:O-antigen ligase
VTLLAVGLLELAIGILFGAPARSALRDVRFFVYVPVITMYLLAWRRRSAIPMGFVVAWYGAVAIQWMALWTGVLVLHPGSVPGEIPTSAGVSPWHFLGAVSFAPLLVSLSALFSSDSRFRMEVFNLIVVLASSAVLVLSFGRSLWLSVAIVGVGVVAVACRGVFRVKPWVVGVLTVVPIAVIAVTSSVWTGIEPIVSRLSDTATFADYASLSRLEDSQWTLGQVAINPLGYGLGTQPVVSGGGYLSGLSLHMGYLWLLYRGGLIGLMAFGYVLIRAFHTARSGEPMSAIRLGFMATFAAWCTMAAASTSMVNFMALPFWGLLLGLILSTSSTARAVKHSVEVGSSRAVRLSR